MITIDINNHTVEVLNKLGLSFVSALAGFCFSLVVMGMAGQLWQ